MEVAFSKGGREEMMYESTAGSTVQRIYHDSMSTYNDYACEYAGDMDGNGHPEFLCGGSDSNQGWVTRIYEAEGNNQFIVRQEIIIWDNYFGVPGLTVGDFDHDGVDEFVIQTAQALHIYKWGGQSYVEEQVIPENFGFILHGIEAYDGDYDGYDEVFWLGIGDGGYWTNDTVILEDVAGMTPPNVLVSMIPDTLPIVIPPAGGTFGYTIEIANQDSVLHTADLKLYVVLPSGSEFIITELSGLQLNPGVNINRHRIQNVPVNAPAGNYIYRIQIGDLPDIVWSEDEFEFVKE
ncbi:MAG: VCBS repeat-containing protein [FCB group bacterium]|nr:VCBS repeat-containing protein [FCB group bacterium]